MCPCVTIKYAYIAITGQGHSLGHRSHVTHWITRQLVQSGQNNEVTITSIGHHDLFLNGFYKVYLPLSNNLLIKDQLQMFTPKKTTLRCPRKEM